jgi:hypothetical protein
VAKIIATCPALTLRLFRKVSAVIKKMRRNHCTNLTKNMQNEPNLRNAQMIVTKALTWDYDKRTLGQRGKNEPKTNPNEPNLLLSGIYFEAVSQSKCCGESSLAKTEKKTYTNQNTGYELTIKISNQAKETCFQEY